MEQIEKEQTEEYGDSAPLRLDAVITSKNHLDAIKRMAYCVKNDGETHVGMTRKNEWAFFKILDILDLFGIDVRVIEEKEYKVGRHDGICKTIVTVKRNN